jgi:hypothetical protein
MKNAILFLMLSIVSLLSCNPKTTTADDIQNNSASTTATENKIMVPATTCYMGTMGKDTFQLKVEVFENVVTGNLAYLFHEKDRQKGTFEGTMEGDTLIANYTFAAEGQTSVRQIAFLLSGEKATEGYGDIEEKNGAMVFKNVKTLRFGKGPNLAKVTCAE